MLLISQSPIIRSYHPIISLYVMYPVCQFVRFHSLQRQWVIPREREREREREIYLTRGCKEQAHHSLVALLPCPWMIKTFDIVSFLKDEELDKFCCDVAILPDKGFSSLLGPLKLVCSRKKSHLYNRWSHLSLFVTSY